MPDSPDYSKYLPGSVRFSLQDMGELAVRLGSIDTYDRRGEVVLLDDGSNGLGGYSVLPPSGIVGAFVTTELAGKGGYSIHIVTGAVADDYFELLKQTPMPVSKRNGMEVSFFLNSFFKYYDLILYSPKDGRLYAAGIRITRSPASLSYLTTAGAWTQFATLASGVTSSGLTSILKFVVDFETGYYIRVLFGGTTYDLSTATVQNVSASNNQVLLFTIGLYSRGGGNATSYMVHTIITANEP